MGVGRSRLAAPSFCIARHGFDALTLFSDAQFFSARRRIAELAATHRLPAMYESREFIEDGRMFLI